MPSRRLDVAALYRALDRLREGADMSWREIARDIEISSATFTRMKAGKRPDVDTLVTLLDWIDVLPQSLARFVKFADD